MALESAMQREYFAKRFSQVLLVLTLSASLYASKSWPWLAYIPSLNCTGAIIHNRWLLTASQCFQDKSIPSNLFIQVQEGKTTRLIYVIDYTRKTSTHNFTLLYLAQTTPSLTQNVVKIPAEYANEALDRNAVVVSWERANDTNILILFIDVNPCITENASHVCVSLSQVSREYCSRLSVGSALVSLNVNGPTTLVGLLQEKPVCKDNFVGKFLRVDYGRKWIEKHFRIQDFPQCHPSVYRTLDDPSRDLRKPRDNVSAICDTEIPRAWYRFTLNGQSAELPTVCPGPSACGTQSSVWLPKASVIELGKQVKIEACASWLIGNHRICCFWRLSVFVRHCGDFKVYHLRRTDFCPTAYCADVTKGICGPGQIGYKPNCKALYPKLSKILQLYPFYAYQGKRKGPYVYLRCLLYDAIKDSSARYMFSFYNIKKEKNGAKTKTMIQRTETSRRYFDIRFRPERLHIALGDTIVCEVRSFFQATRHVKSPALVSSDYYIGVEVHPSSSLVLSYPQVINVTFLITLPVVCRTEYQNCTLTIPLTTSISDIKTGRSISSGSYFTLSKCSLLFTPKSCARNKVVCGRTTVQIQAEKNFKTSNIKLEIQLGPTISNDYLWKDHKLPVIQAALNTTPQFFCYFLSTSNIKTFEGSFYKHLGEGTFLFYSSTLLLTEVYVRKWRCNGVSSCLCAVAVREGNDIIEADMCHGRPKKSSLRFIIRSKLPLHRDIRILRLSSGRSFIIKLPSGSQIHIDEYYWGVSIFLSVADLGQGLCRDATPATLKAKKRWFNESIHIPRSRTAQDFCSCSGLINQAQTSCSPAISSPIDATDITVKIVNKQQLLLKGFGLKRKSALEEDFQADGPSQSLSYERKEEICHQILNTSEPLLMCKDLVGRKIWGKIWQICIEEIQEGFDMALLKSSGESLTMLCKQKIENIKDDQVLLARWKNDMCENRCGENGHCYQGNCNCNEGYGSNDCSVHLNSPPTIFPLEDPLCDTRQELCDEMFISGSVFLNVGSLSCSFTPVQRIGKSWLENSIGAFTSKAIYYSLRGVICKIPQNHRSSFIKSQEIFQIRVSNNGYQWSNPLLRVIYDSLCKNCTSVASCVTQTGTCSIDSRCFINGDISPSNKCFQCSSNLSPHKWTLSTDNLPPFFNSPQEESVTLFVGDEVSFLVNVSDPEGGLLKITHDVPQAHLDSSGRFRWRPEGAVTRTIKFLATDACGKTGSKHIDVIVRKCLCKNNGHCVKLSKNEFQCVCEKRFKGVYCEEKISPCLSSPCLHGKCKETDDSFSCICDPGYHGNLCHRQLSTCSANPCIRGKCEELPNGYQCKCPRFYGGRYCHIQLSPCARDPCVRGDCYSNDGESFECACPLGYHGKLCSKKITACSPNPCHRGRCIKMQSNMRCACPAKYHGKFCNFTKLYCGKTRCVNGVCDATGQQCICREGYFGPKCNISCNIDCANGACSWTSRGIMCECHAGYSGPSCRTKTKSCDSRSCVHGVCINLSSSYICHCYPGYHDTSCNTSACSSVNCHNGTCMLVKGQAVCRCVQGFIGSHCDRKRQPCDANPCLRGLCVAVGTNSFKCSCSPGYEGVLCDTRINVCLSKPCGAGSCELNNDGNFTCKCPPGYVDSFCTQKFNPCHMNPCVHGTCKGVSEKEFRCECEGAYVGRLCEKRFDICASNPCVNGRCLSVLEGTFTCACNSSFSGALCQIDHRPCSKTPCFPGVRCENLNEKEFRCSECPDGYVGNGIKCHPGKVTVVPCPRQFCFPGVICSIVNSQIRCGLCPLGFFGNGFHCTVSCDFPCLNGGVCTSPGICKCRPGFIGATCARAFCKRGCLNGGRCTAPGKCRCPLAYFGDRCENARCSVKCMNGGKCIPPGKCRCLPGYVGSACEKAVCLSRCLNGGQCVTPGTCRCLPGYFGRRCEQGTCTPRCRNGGTCIRNNVCSCPEGYRGSRCQSAVCQKPCQNGGRCFKRNECSCPYGYWGKLCQHVYCLRRCLNGGVCIKPNVCLCSKAYAGITCENFVG